MRLRRALLALATPLLLAAPVRGEDKPAPKPAASAPAKAEAAPARPSMPEPYHLVRALQMMQEEAARGSAPAAGETEAFLRQIAAQFAAAKDEVWADPRNARAAAIFLFSGGAPSGVRPLLLRDKLPERERALVRGALAFAEGREGPARELLLPLDPRKAAPNVGGHLALAQATLIGRREPEKYFEALGFARLLMPGTVVEEAALRREIDFAADLDRAEKVGFLIEQYLRRFPRSIYAPPFQQRLAGILAARILDGEPDAAKRAADALDLLPYDRRLEVQLATSRAALRAGKVSAAALTAGRALKQAKPDTPAAAQAALYLSAAEIVGARYDLAKTRVAALPPAALEEGDRRLRLAVMSVADRLRIWPPRGEPAERPKAAEAAADAAIARAQKALDDVAAYEKGLSP
ncbi:MAG TPA: hypothetical protein VIL72_10110 [Beijerinckiaceae bacterium]|jgi:chemotaxis protein MotC